MQRMSAHQWKSRGSSWTGPIQVLTSGPSPCLTVAGWANSRIKAQEAQKIMCLCAFCAFSRLLPSPSCVVYPGILCEDFLVTSLRRPIQPKSTRRRINFNPLQSKSMSVNISQYQ